jgi:hypothetical protein
MTVTLMGLEKEQVIFLLADWVWDQETPYQSWNLGVGWGSVRCLSSVPLFSGGRCLDSHLA